MGYRIGSFNMCNLSYESKGEVKKDFEKIAEIISSENFDIVAMQEVVSESALKHMVKNLRNGQWKCKWGRPKSYHPNAEKGYAFVWNERRVREIPAEDNLQIIQEKTMTRSPFYARFEANDCFCEIRLLDIHLYHGGSDSQMNIEKRNEEFLNMAGKVYPRISQKRYKMNDEANGSCRPAYNIMLGDYNLNLKTLWNSSPYLKYEQYEIPGTNEVIVTVQNQKTTLKKYTSDETTDADELRGYKNNFDHCSYGINRFVGVNIRASKVDAVRKYFGDDFKKYRDTVSDHVPILVELDLNPNGNGGESVNG